MCDWEYISVEESKALEALEESKPPRNSNCYRVAGIDSHRTCYLFYNKICIGTLTEERNDANETDWVFTFDWEAYDSAGAPDIIGIETDLRLSEYVRNNIPAFVAARTKSDHYEDLENELKRIGLNQNDRFEYMLRTHGICSKDRIHIGRTPTDNVAFSLRKEPAPSQPQPSPGTGSSTPPVSGSDATNAFGNQ